MDLTNVTNDWAVKQGFTQRLPLSGEVGFTELAAHMGVHRHIGLLALVIPDKLNYAYVFLADPDTGHTLWTHGCFNYNFDTHNFTIS
jgi:hypothetical protein